MRLTTFSDYSLRVLIYLAADPDQRATIAQIAQAFGVSENHLMKVVHFLGKEGLLHNVRGKGGGMELARAPDQIRIGSVVRACEVQLPAECFDPAINRCVITPACKLKHALSRANDAFYATLDEYTLEDVSANRKALAKILLTQSD